MASQPLVLVSSSESVTTVTINRPEQRNCLTKDTVTELVRAFELTSKDPTVRCVLLRGAGSEAFCAGADLRELIDNASPESRRALFDSIATLIEKIHRCPVPVVALVHGFAMAGGCGIAAACDITVASDDATFGLPEVGIGLAPMVVMAPISRVLSRKSLSYLVLTGERIPAKRALEMGLVSRVVAKAQADSESLTVCKELCKQSPVALRASKAKMLEVAEREYFPLLHELADESALISLSPDAVEGMKAFVEKRPPAWRV